MYFTYSKGLKVTTESNTKSFSFQKLLIWSCSGIACCLALLGAYCDPRLHLFSWAHIHKLFPYKHKAQNITRDFPMKIQDVFAQNWTEVENFTKSVAPPWSRISVEDISDTTEFENVPNALNYWIQNSTDFEAESESIWPPVVLLSMVFFLFNIGLGSVPYILIADMFPISVSNLYLLQHKVQSSIYYSNYLNIC